jgi:hypothetical protein
MLVLIAAVLAVGVAVAAAAPPPAPKWNSGYNGWWPGGFGLPPLTAQANGYPCSLTAYGPTFHSHHSGWTQDYGAGASCARGVGVKTTTISDQVLGNHGRTWYTISGSTFTSGPTGSNPVRTRQNRAAFLGRAYRGPRQGKARGPQRSRRLLGDQHVRSDADDHRDEPRVGAVS